MQSLGLLTNNKWVLKKRFSFVRTRSIASLYMLKYDETPPFNYRRLIIINLLYHSHSRLPILCQIHIEKINNGSLL